MLFVAQKQLGDVPNLGRKSKSVFGSWRLHDPIRVADDRSFSRTKKLIRNGISN